MTNGGTWSVNRKRFMIGIALALMLTFSVSQVFAAWYNYNMTVPRLGGVNRTGNVTKAAFGNYQVSGSHGAGYTLKVRLEKVDNSSLSSWVDFPSGSSQSLANSGTPSQTVHLALKNNNLVSVQSIGQWSPDP